MSGNGVSQLVITIMSAIAEFERKRRVLPSVARPRREGDLCAQPADQVVTGTAAPKQSDYVVGQHAAGLFNTKLCLTLQICRQ